jgi:Zn-dependent protease with chaperone function
MVAHGDTAGGNTAMQVSATIHYAAYGLASQGMAAWYNPAWLFINSFYKIFLRVSQGAARLQEIHADRLAIINYGANAFSDGLKHVIKRSLQFETTAKRELNQAIQENRIPHNLFNLQPSAEENKELMKEYKDALALKSGEFDSHPSAQQRIEWAERMQTDEIVRVKKGGITELLPDLDAHADEMTREIYENIKARIDAADQPVAQE